MSYELLSLSSLEKITFVIFVYVMFIVKHLQKYSFSDEKKN